MSETVAIIPCGAKKASEPRPARELYTSSRFAATLAAAEAIDDDVTVYVLSGKHGLVTLDTVLAPYDLKMGDEGSVAPETVAAQAAALGIEWGTDVFALLPKTYFGVLDAALRQLDVYAQDIYEADAGLGYQRHTCRVIRETAA